MNENQEQNLNNNIFNDYKKYIKRPGAKTPSTKVGEICRIIAIILFISGIISIYWYSNARSIPHISITYSHDYMDVIWWNNYSKIRRNKCLC